MVVSMKINAKMDRKTEEEVDMKIADVNGREVMLITSSWECKARQKKIK